MQFILDYLPYFWLAVAIIMAIIEAATMGLTTIWFGLAALISMVLAFFNIPMVWQVLIFLVISGVLLIFTRPVAVKKLNIGKEKTNSESLVGQSAVVIAEITQDQKGQVKVGGQIWSAASVNTSSVGVDSRVKIERIEGVTLIVSVVNE